MSNMEDPDTISLHNSLTSDLQPVIHSLLSNFTTIKTRLLDEHSTVVLDLNTKYSDETARLNAKIKALEDDLVTEKTKVTSMTLSRNTTNESTAIRHVKNILLRSSLHCFNSWRDYTKQRFATKKLEKVAGKWFSKSTYNKTFVRWAKFANNSKTSRNDNMHETKLETVTREIITRYENELEKLRANLLESHQEIARGHVQRQQLEEKMRRTFLKGMTAMNLETLNMFNQAKEKDEGFAGKSESFSEQQSPVLRR